MKPEPFSVAAKMFLAEMISWDEYIERIEWGRKKESGKKWEEKKKSIVSWEHIKR